MEYQDSTQGHINGFTHISESIQKTEQKIRKIISGELKPIITSSQKINDKVGGFYPSDQIVLAARTGTGKTAYALRDIRDFVELNPAYKIIILYWSWEMPDWRNVLRLYSREQKISVSDIINYKYPLSLEAFDRIRQFGKLMSKFPVYFSNAPLNVEQWMKKVLEVQGQYPGYVIINLVDHTRLVKRDNEKSEEQLISSFMMAGMELKNKIECINYFLTQMNRNIETNNKSREDAGKTPPMASDIFGSDSVFQCADIVMALHRPGMYGVRMYLDRYPTGITDTCFDDNFLANHILKQRDGWTGMLSMKHNLAINHIEDFNDEETTESMYGSSGDLFE